MKRILLSILSMFVAASVVAQVTVGALRTDRYVPQLRGKRVALLSNHTGVVDSDGTHTLDLMQREGVDVRVILSPEHGFRGTADAGEHVSSSVDAKSGLPVVSLYGNSKGDPLATNMLDTIDAVVIDMQDVGVRFYTYHITMIRVMEAASRAGCKVYVFDRPNPIGMIVDGPMLADDLHSGVGRLPIPVIHGMTMGEIALMANGEHWLKDSLQCDLTVVPCNGYTHATRYALPVAPSPNLKDMQAIYLYPSLCLFEGTAASVGRGTDYPFNVYGHPGMLKQPFSFTPRSMPGAKRPPHLGTECHGVDLRTVPVDDLIAAGLDWQYVINAYNAVPRQLQPKFFNNFFDKLVGDRRIRPLITGGATADSIKSLYRRELDDYRRLRTRYLIYPEQ